MPELLQERRQKWNKPCATGLHQYTQQTDHTEPPRPGLLPPFEFIHQQSIG